MWWENGKFFYGNMGKLKDVGLNLGWWPMELEVLPIQLPLNLTFALKRSKFKYFPQSRSCDILGPCDIGHIALCDILGLCDITLLLYKQLYRKYFNFDCFGANERGLSRVANGTIPGRNHSEPWPKHVSKQRFWFQVRFRLRTCFVGSRPGSYRRIGNQVQLED